MRKRKKKLDFTREDITKAIDRYYFTITVIKVDRFIPKKMNLSRKAALSILKALYSDVKRNLNEYWDKKELEG